MTSEPAVAAPESNWRAPRRDVWETVTKLARHDPATGKSKRVRAVIVRWRNAQGTLARGESHPNQRAEHDGGLPTGAAASSRA
jgi:hypothetical protein